MRALLLLAALTLTGCGDAPAPAAPPGPPRIGMNLDGIAYYQRAFPFIDRMKTASDWEANSPFTGTLELDTQGYPLRLPNGVPSLHTIVQVDPASAGTSRRYVILYKGRASFGFRNLARMVQDKPGRKVILLDPGAPYLPIDIEFDARDRLRDMHVVREDQEPLLAAGQVFNPAFLDKLRPFDTIRTMDWQRTNSADRPAPLTGEDHVSWAFAGDAVPLTVQVRLANELGRNLWWNVPFQADDAYVAAGIRTIKAGLKSGLKLYVEYANEMWNWAFPVATLAQAKAQTAGMSDIGAAGWGGYRAAQVARVARAAWGSDPDKRLRTVIGVQASYPGLSTWHILPGVRKVGAPGALFDAYAVTTYFYGPLVSDGSPAWARTVAQARGGEAGLASFFTTLETESLPALAKSLAEQAAIAKANRLELIAYEGGHHLVMPAGQTGDDVKVVGEMVNRALADRRMGRLYTRMIDLFAANGGTLLTAFNEAGNVWGVLPDIYAAGSPRYDALVAANRVGAAGQPPATRSLLQ